MPVTKSARKALKVAARRKSENDVIRASVRKAVKAVRLGGKEAGLDKAQSALAKAANKHVIHKNKARRLTSRLAKLTSTAK